MRLLVLPFAASLLSAQAPWPALRGPYIGQKPPAARP